MTESKTEWVSPVNKWMSESMSDFFSEWVKNSVSETVCACVSEHNKQAEWVNE